MKMKAEEFLKKYTDNRSAAEKNEEFDCYIKGTNKLKPEVKKWFRDIIEEVIKEVTRDEKK